MVYSMKQISSYHDNVQLTSTNVVVSILASVRQCMYSHKHGADYTTVHYMVYVQTTYYKQLYQMVPFLIAGHVL